VVPGYSFAHPGHATWCSGRRSAASSNAPPSPRCRWTHPCRRRFESSPAAFSNPSAGGCVGSRSRHRSSTLRPRLHAPCRACSRWANEPRFEENDDGDEVFIATLVAGRVVASWDGLSEPVRRSSTSEGGSETHRGRRNMRWVSQGLDPSALFSRAWLLPVEVIV